KEKYAGLRNLFAFSQNPALAPSFARCVEGEKPYQTRIAETIEVSAREATTVAEQKDYQDAAVFRKQNLGSVATAMCLYRPNFSTVMAQVNDVGAAMMLGKGEHLPR
ncbi:MAG: hypothetical protein ACJ8AI_26040, partial [Rhodopila sp.]